MGPAGRGDYRTLRAGPRPGDDASMNVDFVLVRPARGANVAAACRALANMGCGAPIVVGDLPPLGPPERALAYGAWDLLDGLRRAESLAAALQDAHLVAATSGRAEPRQAWTPRELARRAGELPAAGRVALVFGPESSGLTLEEQSSCPVVVRIPTPGGHSSLNLAQAVLVLAYELQAAGGPAVARAPLPPRHGELELALAQWRAALEAIGYLDPQSPWRRLAELRRLLARARPSSRELALLRGLARQVGWAGDVARARRGNG